MTDKEAMKLALFALEIVKTHFTQNRHVNEAITALKERLAQPEHEPIQNLQCFHCQDTIETLNDKVMQLMAKRTWVGLTDDEIGYIAEDYATLKSAIKAAELQLKEKNT